MAHNTKMKYLQNLEFFTVGDAVLLPSSRTTAAQEANITTLKSLLQHVTKFTAQTRCFYETY